MKLTLIKLIIVALFATFPQANANAQSLQLANLFKLISLNIDEIEDQLLNGGYKLMKIDNLQNESKNLVYFSKNIESSDVVSISITKGGDVFDVSYSLSNKADLLSFKKQIKDNGYIFKRSVNKVGKPNSDITGSVWSIYTNNNQKKYVIKIVRSYTKKYSIIYAIAVAKNLVQK